MNKGDLIDAIAQDTGLTKVASERVLDSLTNNATKALERGEKVKFIGIGSLKVIRRNARTGRNPRTGQPLQIPAKNVVRYLQSKLLKV